MRTRILIFVITVTSFTNVFAQTSPRDIVTDRPDQTESPDLVPPGYVQIESGVTYERYADDFSNTQFEFNATGFQSLIRIGVFPSMELRIAPQYAIYSSKVTIPGLTVFDNRNSGFTPLVIGTKIKITDETTNIPAIAFLFNVDLPKVASEDFENEYSNSEFRLAFSKQLSDRFSLGANGGALYQLSTQSVIGLYTLALGANIYENLGGFIEFYGFFYPDNDDIHYFDGGLTYLLSKNIQFDVSGGIGLTDNTTDFRVGAGLSVRLPR